MLEYSTDAFKFLRSKLGKRIGILVFIQIFFIIISLVILSYYQSQMTYLGNSINIAGKNRFLASNLMLSTTEYFAENSGNISKVDTAIDQLESNILILKNGGETSDINLKPLPSEFSKDWDDIYQKWILLKTILSNNILKESQINNPVRGGIVTISSSFSSSSSIPLDKNIKTILEAEALSLVNSSNVLVTKLGEYTKNSSQNTIFLQILFAVLNIGVITAFILYIIRKILKPIFALTTATSEVKRGNLEVAVKSKVNGNDELAFLSESFNSMVTAIKNDIKKQNQLTSELEKANKELKYRDQLKDEFINIAAHELRNPIQPILGLSELLRTKEIENIKNSGEIDIEKIENILDIIIRNSKRLMQLEEEILDITRIESGNLILNKEKINLIEMITEMLREYEEKMIQSKKDLKLFYEAHNNADEIFIVESDRNRLIQVVTNLLNNAIKFTNEGIITVTVERKKDDNSNNNEIVVSIKDTGTGIDAEILPKLFTKFATKSKAEGGTGLGLFISKNIIERHGGRMWAINNTINNGDGKGSTFSFSLPISK
jgi:signal transduction histidine kinase